jgi:threonine dehydrogenase-like Zn-dependent dehydrogenase
VWHGTSVVDYIDTRDIRLEVADALGANTHKLVKGSQTSVLDGTTGRYDVVVEASSQTQRLRDALRALRPGGICTGNGYYLAPGTKVPVMDVLHRPPLGVT